MANYLFSRRGFTMPEVILTVTVLAILTSISMPAIVSFIRQNDIRNEESRLQELRLALQAFMNDKNTLPRADNPATPEVEWAKDLAGYTNLSITQMVSDTWGNPRSFISYTDETRKIQEAVVPINYVSIMSSGPDRIATAVPGKVAVVGNAFAPATDAGWWARAANELEQFSRLASAGDDLLVKFTDNTDKLNRFYLTLQRMDRVAASIEALARSNYADVIAWCNTLERDGEGKTGQPGCDDPGVLERRNFYPIGLPTNGDDFGVESHYHWLYYVGRTVPVSEQVVVSNSPNDTIRRNEMTRLMRLLGLPNEFCCSALEMGSDNLPKPFFYFSNPRPKTVSGGCGVRPGLNQPGLPARITTINNDSGASPTCG